MSAKTVQRLRTLGMTLLMAYDNFDILLKPTTTTLENNVDPLKHLTWSKGINPRKATSDGTEVYWPRSRRNNWEMVSTELRSVTLI